MAKVKVLIVDDSAFMRKILTDILTDASQIDVVGTAKKW
jgi:two-component system chemotaxis response regulator CheB